jgi:signal recognition particle subunit SRP54
MPDLSKLGGGFPGMGGGLPGLGGGFPGLGSLPRPGNKKKKR